MNFIWLFIQREFVTDDDNDLCLAKIQRVTYLLAIKSKITLKMIYIVLYIFLNNISEKPKSH